MDKIWCDREGYWQYLVVCEKKCKKKCKEYQEKKCENDSRKKKSYPLTPDCSIRSR